MSNFFFFQTAQKAALNLAEEASDVPALELMSLSDTQVDGLNLGLSGPLALLCGERLLCC